MGDDAVVQKVSDAIKDRALYLALLYRSFSKELPAKKAEKLARGAIYEYGRFKGRRAGRKITAEEWLQGHMASGAGVIYGSRVVVEKDRCELQISHCPLIDAWKELGCSEKEIDLLCDIAMEVDRGMAAHHGIPCEIRERIGKGDSICRLVLKKA